MITADHGKRDTSNSRRTLATASRQARINAFRIQREWVALLAKLNYIPSDASRLNAEAMADHPGEPDWLAALLPLPTRGPRLAQDCGDDDDAA